MMSVFHRLTAGLVIGALSFTVAGTANAQTATNQSEEVAKSAVRLIQGDALVDFDAPLTAAEQQAVPELAAELEFVFTNIMKSNTDGTYSFDYEYAVQHAGQARADEFKAEYEQAEKAVRTDAKRLAVEANSSAYIQFDWERYAHCVLNKSGYGFISGLITGSVAGEIGQLIYARAFTQAAEWLIRIVGPAAIKGGVAGLAIALGASAAWCLTPWAKAPTNTPTTLPKMKPELAA